MGGEEEKEKKYGKTGGKKNIRGGAGGEESVQTACYIVLDTYDITIFRLGLCLL